ncbi:MAG TPA: cytochrome C oxidase subunit IV family protein [Candidatus Eisenbacteria bacterium]|nr:cytochrome C oxidase subunit IV family protein [Candidatus Eisenbacteria bacterium]
MGVPVPDPVSRPLTRPAPPAVATLVGAWLALLALLALTVTLAHVPLGAWNAALALAIAIAKALLIVLVFMHVRHASRLTQVFSALGFVWLMVLFSLLMSDALTRTPLSPWP